MILTGGATVLVHGGEGLALLGSDESALFVRGAVGLALVAVALVLLFYPVLDVRRDVRHLEEIGQPAFVDDEAAIEHGLLDFEFLAVISHAQDCLQTGENDRTESDGVRTFLLTASETTAPLDLSSCSSWSLVAIE